MWSRGYRAAAESGLSPNPNGLDYLPCFDVQKQLLKTAVCNPSPPFSALRYVDLVLVRPHHFATVFGP